MLQLFKPFIRYKDEFLKLLDFIIGIFQYIMFYAIMQIKNSWAIEEKFESKRSCVMIVVCFKSRLPDQKFKIILIFPFIFLKVC